MKRFGGIFCVALIMVTLLSGCSEPSGLDPKHPVTLTLWHNFGGQMQATMDTLVDEFNGTVGKETASYSASPRSPARPPSRRS